MDTNIWVVIFTVEDSTCSAQVLAVGYEDALRAGKEFFRNQGEDTADLVLQAVYGPYDYVEV